MGHITNFLLTGQWDIPLGLAIFLLACCYVHGLMTVWQRAGIGHGVTLAQAGLFAAGVLTLVLALASPLHPLGEMLFAAHMAQHLLLIGVAAPLLMLGAPTAAFTWALPRTVRRPLAQWWQRQRALQQFSARLGDPLWVGSLFGATLWLWHAPPFYEAALQDARWHALEHSTLLGVALLFWQVANPTPTANGHRRGAAILLLLTTAMHSGLLGALLTFAATPWYANYQITAQFWGIAPLADQQLAGVLMWWPMGLVFGGAVLWQVAIWLKTPGYETPKTHEI